MTSVAMPPASLLLPEDLDAETPDGRVNAARWRWERPCLGWDGAIHLRAPGPATM